MYLQRISLTLSAIVLPIALFSQQPDSYQIHYAANLTHGESYIDITNTGYINGSSPAGDICANVYVYDAREEIQACCTCPTTPNGLYSLGVNRDLISNTLTRERPASVAIKLTATVPVAGVCDATAPGPFTSGLRVWGTTLHAAPNGTYVVTETQFANAAPVSTSETSKLYRQCAAIREVGMGQGICSSCRIGGLSVAPVDPLK